MKIQIITLFPEMFEGVFEHSMILKAKKMGASEIEFINLRDFGLGPRHQVDDTPYGGGDGMLLKPEPLFAAVEHAKETNTDSDVILLTPRGHTYRQSIAGELAKKQGMILLCGRYEGFDERITEVVDREISVGNFVLTGGEIPAMVVVDSVVRLLPGVLGGEKSAEIESFSEDDITVEFPQYTRPEVFRDMKVPDVLLSGHHQEIEIWRREQAEKRTKELGENRS